MEYIQCRIRENIMIDEQKVVESISNAAKIILLAYLDQFNILNICWLVWDLECLLNIK